MSDAVASGPTVSDEDFARACVAFDATLPSFKDAQKAANKMKKPFLAPRDVVHRALAQRGDLEPFALPSGTVITPRKQVTCYLSKKKVLEFDHPELTDAAKAALIAAHTRVETRFSVRRPK